ncbi:FkbM family methyltransferase [Leptolyngbya sp. FACHB-17]|uniref:FkbM family methyltransferase n=1 Tax=unclassified Leptolyngbya TaxID=2650499 RepID=UPI0016814C16|nr:FkbM family methyltransferase [Leptolyngbya sp. FACHB-17]MBD2081728.1 FkbM family methyltransferase [Leptolyngbya sp. FACHB-17]
MTTVIEHSSSSLRQEIQRRLLNVWGVMTIAPGWHYQAFEKFGECLSNRSMCRAVLPNDCSLMCDLRDHVQRQIYFLGTYEPIEAYLFNQLLKPGMTVIDAGANIGQYTLLAATGVGETGAVHSFEPVPTTFSQLRQNVEDNSLPNVYLNQAGLWYKSASIALGLSSEMLQNCGAYSIGVLDQATEVSAIALTLDDYAAQRNIQKVDLIKMDIEGAEYAALMGMQAIIQRDRPVFLMEVNTIALDRMGYQKSQIWQFMVKEQGYTAYGIGITACKLLQNLDEIAQSNVIFVHPSCGIDLTQTTWNFKGVLRWSRRCKALL